MDRDRDSNTDAHADWSSRLASVMQALAADSDDLEPLLLSPSVVNIVAHAPMHPRLRNQLINRTYAFLANRLARLVYPNHVPDDAAPNFFCFAHWASAMIGQRMGSLRGRLVRRELEHGNAVVYLSMTRALLAFERRIVFGELPDIAQRQVDEVIPPVARVGADVGHLVGRGSATASSLVDPNSGIPPQLVRALGLTPEASGPEILRRIRARAFDAYLAARNAGDDATRRHAILQGNAWLVLSEQALVDPALAAATRMLIRRVADPSALFASTRSIRNKQVAPDRLRLEDGWIVRLSEHIEWPAPADALPDLRPVSDDMGVLDLTSWLETGAAALPAGQPFDWFTMPDPARQPIFWPALSDRLPVIFCVLAAAHDGVWFSDGSVREHPRWAEATRLSPPSATHAPPAHARDQRETDWATAHRLYRRDKELILAALFARSLPATYASPTGAAVLDPESLGASGVPRPAERSMIGDALPRLLRSAGFIDAMLANRAAPGSPTDRGVDGSPSKQELLASLGRIHRAVRAETLRAVSVKPEVGEHSHQGADPMGYEQCVGAGTAFVVPVVEVLHTRFAVEWTPNERDSWSRVWLEITHQQGLATALMRNATEDFLGWRGRPVSSFIFEDLALAARVIGDRNRASSLAGVRLADELRRSLEEVVPLHLRPLVLLGLEVFGDPETNRSLMVPASRLAPLAGLCARRSPSVTRRLCRRFIRRVLAEAAMAEPSRPWDEAFSPRPNRVHTPTNVPAEPVPGELRMVA